jgi:Fe2+ transport system protein FeoA
MTARNLTQFARGRMARIVSVQAECASKNRLAALGLVPGEVIEVLSASAHGPCVIAFKESRLALQRDLADCLTLRDV